MSFNIKNIEQITESEAKEAAIETAEIKGFNIYFVDFGGSFGYSYLVFKDDHHIHYANDYELHHSWLAKEEGKEALREYYLRSIDNKLFTDEEIMSPIKSYFDYRNKSYFLNNYYAMQRDRVSRFCINPTDEEKATLEKAKKTMAYDPVGFCFIADEEFVEHHKELKRALEASKNDTKNNFEYQKNAFMYEMSNHEYAINWQADYDTLSAFGHITPQPDFSEDINKYFDELKFTQIQRDAYVAARKEYMKKQVVA